MKFKKTKLDPNKVIKVEPKKFKHGPDLGMLFAMILGFLLGMILISCYQQPTKRVPEKTQELIKDPNTENYYLKVTEYTYEGCEYIKVGYGKSIWGSHKGNCKNPIHKNDRSRNN